MCALNKQGVWAFCTVRTLDTVKPTYFRLDQWKQKQCECLLRFSTHVNTELELLCSTGGSVLHNLVKHHTHSVCSSSADKSVCVHVCVPNIAQWEPEMHLPPPVFVSLPFHFTQHVVDGPQLRGDGVDLDPDSIRVRPWNPGPLMELQATCSPPVMGVTPASARDPRLD